MEWKVFKALASTSIPLPRCTSARRHFQVVVTASLTQPNYQQVSRIWRENPTIQTISYIAKQQVMASQIIWPLILIWKMRFLGQWMFVLAAAQGLQGHWSVLGMWNFGTNRLQPCPQDSDVTWHRLQDSLIARTPFLEDLSHQFGISVRKSNNWVNVTW